jgi:hypothetical protein
LENNLAKEGDIEEIGEEIPEVVLQAENVLEESVLTVNDNVDSESISEPVLKTEDIEQETAQPALERNIVENSLEPEIKVQEVESIPESHPLPPAPRSGINFGFASSFFK